MANHMCPHCGGEIRVTLFPAGKSRQQRRARRKDQFESAVHFDDQPPAGPGLWNSVKSFWHVVVQDRPLRLRQPARHIEVRSEVKLSTGQIFLNNLNIPLSEKQARELAYTYLGLGLSWSRDNTEQNTSISQGHHITLTELFVELLMIEKIVKQTPGKKPHIRYILLPHGKRVFRQFDPSPPPAHSAYVDH